MLLAVSLLSGCSVLDRQELARMLRFEQECQQAWGSMSGNAGQHECVEEKALLWQARADAVMRMPGQSTVSF